MKIESVRYEGGELKLSTSDPEARRFVYQFKPGDYDLVKAKKKRSLDANAYMWELCTKISEATGATKDEVYRHNIREGNEYTPLLIEAVAVKSFAQDWEKHGTGWFVELVDDSKLPGHELVRAYHGSSGYDTKQMSVLIDRVVQDAKALDIETLPPDRLNSMMEAWDAKQTNKSA